MKNIISTYKHILHKLAICCLLLLAFQGCKKADNFYATLKALPQIDNGYGYNTAYVVGDTMVIIGKLQPKNNLQISIGGVTAQIVKIDSVPGAVVVINQKQVANTEDKVSLLITAAMVGAAREVKVTSAGNSTIGASIDVYSAGGPGSFNSALKAVLVTPTTMSATDQFLYGVTGKGDVYYYEPGTKKLWHIAKDGTTTMLYDLSALRVTSFLAGGVDPQAQNLYFSVQLASGYALYKLNLQNQALTTLNQSGGLGTPYQGAIGTVQMIVTGVWPDSKGNLYLGIGLGNRSAAPDFVPDAIARYDATDGSIRYIYKELNIGQSYTGMPGVKIPASNILSVRFSPDENLLYAITQFSGVTRHIGIQLYDLTANVLLQNLEPAGTASNYNVIAPFSGLQISLPDNTTDNDFGFLPMPGKRLQVLLYQFIGQYGTPNQASGLGFPKWIVFDFTNLRTYAYAPGRFDTQNYAFGPYDRYNEPTVTVADQLLNYDETGNLYMTSNGQMSLIKTQPEN